MISQFQQIQVGCAASCAPGIRSRITILPARGVGSPPSGAMRNLAGFLY